MIMIQLTSTHDTPLYVRKEAILVIEGFDFDFNHPQCPGHTGSRLTLAAGQWTETVYAKQTSKEVSDIVGWAG